MYIIDTFKVMAKVRQKREEVTSRSQAVNSIKTTPKLTTLPKAFQLREDCGKNDNDKLAKVKHFKIIQHKSSSCCF